ncbi:MAG TPA: TIGR03618 family F420-dependent PPOX class oxidoreductase [Actinomycetota bacterium]|nr:TIGR03618 family F420-dependent PPOX class oxidoreductase [Actinomycetota bacterium]
MRHDLPTDAIEAFLERPIVAVLATHRRDGTVLLSPVWYRWRDGGFDVSVGAEDVKVRHLRRDPRAALVVAEQTPPYTGVEIRATASLLPDEGGRVAGEIASRYGQPSAGGDLVIRLEPGDLRTWDFADEYPPA